MRTVSIIPENSLCIVVLLVREPVAFEARGLSPLLSKLDELP